MICGVRALSSQTLEAANRLVGQQDKKQQHQDSCSGDINTYRFIQFDRIKSSFVHTTLLPQ